MASTFGLLALLATDSAVGQSFYAGVDFGVAQIEEEETPDAVSLDDNSLAWRLNLGLEFNEYVGIEGSYFSTGDIDGSLATVGINFPPPIEFETEFEAISLSIVGTQRVSDAVSLFGKLGYFDGKMEIAVPSAPFFADIDESGLSAGAGIRLTLTDGFALRGEFDWYDTEIDTVWALSVGIQYRFGQ